MFRKKDEPEFQWLEDGIITVVTWSCQVVAGLAAVIYKSACLIIGVNPSDPE